MLIGITGDIAAGKSHLTAMLASHFATLGHNVLAVNADSEARAVLVSEGYNLGDLHHKLFERRDIWTANRAQALCSKHFTSCYAKYQYVESPLVILDAPLLFEYGLDQYCDVTIYVSAEASVRKERCLERGWAADELHLREQLLLPSSVKQRHSTFVVKRLRATPDVLQLTDRIIRYCHLDRP